jgi:hypothetical protein
MDDKVVIVCGVQGRQAAGASASVYLLSFLGTAGFLLIGVSASVYPVQAQVQRPAGRHPGRVGGLAA